eukprot:2951913-Amphidinium_carterae.1
MDLVHSRTPRLRPESIRTFPKPDAQTKTVQQVIALEGCEAWSKEGFSGVRFGGSALEFASDALRADPEIVLLAESTYG